MGHRGLLKRVRSHVCSSSTNCQKGSRQFSPRKQPVNKQYIKQQNVVDVKKMEATVGHVILPLCCGQ